MSEVRVKMRHVRAVSLTGQGVQCVPGIRTWFACRGLDYRRLMRDGFTEAEVLATGDAFALKALEQARKEAGHG